MWLVRGTRASATSRDSRWGVFMSVHSGAFLSEGIRGEGLPIYMGVGRGRSELRAWSAAGSQCKDTNTGAVAQRVAFSTSLGLWAFVVYVRLRCWLIAGGIAQLWVVSY